MKHMQNLTRTYQKLSVKKTHFSFEFLCDYLLMQKMPARMREPLGERPKKCTKNLERDFNCSVIFTIC